MKNKIIIIVSILLLVIAAAAGIGQRFGYWDLKKLKGQFLPSYTTAPLPTYPTITPPSAIAPLPTYPTITPPSVAKLPENKDNPAPSSATATLPTYPTITPSSVAKPPQNNAEKQNGCTDELSALYQKTKSKFESLNETYEEALQTANDMYNRLNNELQAESDATYNIYLHNPSQEAYQKFIEARAAVLENQKKYFAAKAMLAEEYGWDKFYDDLSAKEKDAMLACGKQ